MSQKSVEILLGKILTDGRFRQAFLPIGPQSFELASKFGLEFTHVERSALSSLRRVPFERLARTLDPRVSRCDESLEAVAVGGEGVSG